MTWSFDDVKRRLPHLADDAIHRVMEQLNAKPEARRKRWENEALASDVPAELGEDGLTDTMRDLNAWAEENALPQPFATKLSKL